jgi:hypothetical protein
MDRVKLQHVSQVFWLEEVVDTDDFDVLRKVLDRSAEDHSSDASESVNTEFNHGNAVFLM